MVLIIRILLYRVLYQGAPIFGNSLMANFGTADLGFIDPVALLTRVVVKIMVPFGVPLILRHLLFRVPKKGP